MYMLPMAPPALLNTHSRLLVKSVLILTVGFSRLIVVSRVSTTAVALGDEEVCAPDASRLARVARTAACSVGGLRR
jgi:hypothetical protein